ncbi:MAG TPA: hypothetical protein VGL39_06920 [Jatrophihabitantaceae bacterium]
MFAAATAPLLAYYRDQGPALSARVVDATGPPDEITAAILAIPIAIATADAS